MADEREIEAVARALHEISDDVLPFGVRRISDRGARVNRRTDKRLEERCERYMEQARVAIAALDAARPPAPEPERLRSLHEQAEAEAVGTVTRALQVAQTLGWMKGRSEATAEHEAALAALSPPEAEGEREHFADVRYVPAVGWRPFCKCGWQGLTNSQGIACAAALEHQGSPDA